MKRWRRLMSVVLLAVATSAAAQTRDVTVRPASPVTTSGFYANSWALVIGVNKYQRVPGLTYAVADAKAVADALPSLGFSKQNIRLLTDEQATKARIESTIDREFKSMGDQDRLFVFFAGHGDTIRIKGGEEGFLLPADADPAAIASTAISMDDVKKIGLRVKAKHVLFVMDACFSGFAATRDVVAQHTTDEYLAAALREPVVQVITAGRKGERAIEDAGHGLFTRRFLDGLRVLSNEGVVTTAQLAAWLEPRVVRDSKGKMTPQYGKLDGEGQFVFVRAGTQLAAIPARPESKQIEIQEEIRQQFGALALSAKIDGVEVWLDGQKIGVTKTGRALIANNVPEGTHRVVARKAGHKDWDREVQILPGRRIEVGVELETQSPGPLSAIHFDFTKWAAEFDPDDADTQPRIEITRSDATASLDATAKWLNQNPGFVVLLEGHTDEFGSHVGSLALGERMAEAAKKYLITRGVAANRITVVSYGQERPVCTEHAEECWARNRRVAFLVKGPGSTDFATVKP